jgi:hypothetical protein
VTGLLTPAATRLVGPAGRPTDRAAMAAADVGAADRTRARTVPKGSNEEISDVRLINMSNLLSAAAADGGA